jgi:hypothetical protein
MVDVAAKMRQAFMVYGQALRNGASRTFPSHAMRKLSLKTAVPQSSTSKQKTARIWLRREQLF